MRQAFIIAAIVALAAINASCSPTGGTCSPSTTKPVFDFPEMLPSDDVDTKFSKMFRGYIRKHQGGQNFYLPLTLDHALNVDEGGYVSEEGLPHNWYETLTMDCGVITFDASQEIKVPVISYHFNNMIYNFGDSSTNCTLHKLSDKGNVHTYACDDADLVIERMDLDKISFSLVPSEYSHYKHKILWS